MFDVRKTFKQALTQTKLFNWHLMLMSEFLNPNLKIATWRAGDEPMQIVSGHDEKWTVHYKAPPAQDIPHEMTAFIRWFNKTAPGKPHEIKWAPIRAAVAHLYFESIHPFEDGSGRSIRYELNL